VCVCMCVATQVYAQVYNNTLKYDNNTPIWLYVPAINYIIQCVYTITFARI